jgi:major membrane immunogen (membrane-anchored lipoprotein)
MRRLVAVLFCAAALVGGCGSDDEQAAPAADSTPTPTQDQSQDRGSYGY